LTASGGHPSWPTWDCHHVDEGELGELGHGVIDTDLAAGGVLLHQLGQGRLDHII
jgi:hypothetical protein